MAKGGGLARLRWLGTDLLEGRMLLSHAPVAIVHVLPPTPAAPRPETEPGRAAVAPSTEVEIREAEEKADSSAASTNKSTIPLLTLGKTTDDSSEADLVVLNPARSLLVTYREEPVAWRFMVEGRLGVGPISRHRVAEAPEVPESAEWVVGGMQPGPIPVRPTAPEAPEEMPSPERSDLLADFLPSDREALDRAIDGLLDGIGVDRSRGVGATTLIPSPVVWGFTLAVLEVFRRRLRPRSGPRAGGEQGPDGDPGDGFLAFRG